MTIGKTVKVGPKGQVVIPKEIRNRLGIEPGERVRVEAGDREVTVRPLPDLDELRGILGPSPDGMSDIEAEHRREIELEERKAARWNR